MQFKLPEEYEDRWITIIYIVDGTYKTLHLVAETHDLFQKWSAALKKLYAIRQGLMTGLGNVESRQLVWERQYWKGADEGGDQVLDFDDVERLCKRLNANLTPEGMRKAFNVSLICSCSRIDFEYLSGCRSLEARLSGLRAVSKFR